VRVKASSRELS